MYFAEKHLEIAKEVTVYVHLLPLEPNQYLPLGHTPLYRSHGEQQGIIASLYAAVLCRHA